MVYRGVKNTALAAMRARIESLRGQRPELWAFGPSGTLRSGQRALDAEIARREAVEAELRACERRLGAIIENSSACIFVKDRTLRYAQVNRPFERFVDAGLPLLGRDDFELFDPETARMLRAHDEAVLAARAPREARECIVHGGRTRHLLATRFPLFDAAGEIEGVGGILTEVTATIAAEEERERLHSTMLRAQKLESLGVLAGGIAHDFNNLLTGILGNVTLSLFELGPRHRAAALLEQIEMAALKASDLTRQLLAYAGKGKFVLEPLDLTRLVSDMSMLLSSTLPSRVRLELDLESSPIPVEADANQLHQVVMNLVLNAAEAVGAGEGLVQVRTKVLPAPPDGLEAAGRSGPLPKGRYALLEVQDDGAGMDASTLDRIFDPFFSTKFAGRGLGLPAILGIVDGHRGAVYVRSAPGVGSTFQVCLPLSEQASPKKTDPSRLSAQLDARFEGTILLVDDEPLSRTATGSMLRKLGFRVIEAEDGVGGVEAFRDHVDEVRLVLLDLTMPRMGGEEVLAAIRALRHDTPVVVMSGYSRDDVNRRFGSLPPSSVLEKPFGVDELVVEVIQHLELRTAAGVR